MSEKPDSSENSSNSGTFNHHESSVTGQFAQSGTAPVPSSKAPVPKKKKDQSKSEQPPKPKQSNKKKNSSGKKSDGDASWIQTSDANDWMVHEAANNLFAPLHFSFSKK